MEGKDARDCRIGAISFQLSHAKRSWRIVVKDMEDYSKRLLVALTLLSTPLETPSVTVL